MTSGSLLDALIQHLRGTSPGAVGEVLDFFRLPDQKPHVLRCAELLVYGRAQAEQLLAQAETRRGLQDAEAVRAAAKAIVDELSAWQVRLTGAEAAMVVLAAAGVQYAFVYPGTSELALCDVGCQVHGLRVINGRGDKEAAFMAAGASLLQPNRGVAVLHGARGLTNAAGAVADARRTEAGTLFLVGLPSYDSAPFLPPHGEPHLMEGMSTFADWTWQAPPIPKDPTMRERAAREYVSRLREALARTATPPHRPGLFGIPQDVAEARWIHLADLLAPAIDRPSTHPDPVALARAQEQLTRSSRSAILIDDYALRYPEMRQSLAQLSRALGAPVLQLRYRRGPMLFERLREDELPNFVGWLNPFSQIHTDLLRSCDLLVTVEDRNLYGRVAGPLPSCRKIAINSDANKVRKNEYLRDGDVLLEGHPQQIVAMLAEGLRRRSGEAVTPWFSERARLGALASPEAAGERVVEGRRGIVRALATAMATWKQPVLVDDSQMFGGLLAEHYDELPPGLRVFGIHGAFVGSGLAYANGLAIAGGGQRVLCTMGDQGFTNCMQGLVAATEQHARVLFVVCNNGEAVSLKKQATTSYGAASRPYLSNVEGLEYCALAAAFGIPSKRVAVPLGGPPGEVEAALSRLTAVLTTAAAVEDGPSFVEIVLPSDPTVWQGIWLTQGFDQKVPEAVK
jgi:acetolactate synthase-1/2/3 large subunit